MDDYYRKVTRDIERLLDANPDADAHTFIRIYEGQHGRFPFYYARANTEFGNVFGRSLSPEDAGWGEFRPADEESSHNDQMKKLEECERRQNTLQKGKAKAKVQPPLPFFDEPE